MIPKIIHNIIGPNITPLIKQCLNSWHLLKLHGFEIRIWNDENLAEFIQENYSFAYDAFKNARNHAEAADIARYLIIHLYGGYYADWDVELLNLNTFTELSERNPDGYLLRDPPNGTLASEYFCACTADPFLLNLVKDIVELYNNNQRKTMETPQYSGPYRMRDSLIKHPQTKMSLIDVKDAFVYDYSEIRNPSFITTDRPLIHYWVHSWID